MAKNSDWTARLAQVKAEIRASRAFFDQFDADGKPVSYTRAARELRAMGLKVTRSEDSEIRVAFPGNESAAYYTDSVEDAAFTGLDMVARAALGATVEDDAEGLAIEAGNHVPGEVFDASEFDAFGEPLDGFEDDAEPVEAAPRRSASILPRAMPRALWSFPASRVADAIDGAEWLCSAESFGFDGSEALAFN